MPRSGGCFYPVDPVRELLLPLWERGELAEKGACKLGYRNRLTSINGVSLRAVRRIIDRDYLTVSERLVDRIITDLLGDPSLWYTTPGLEPVPGRSAGPRHGTNAMYTAEGCRCERCRRAHADAQRHRRARVRRQEAMT